MKLRKETKFPRSFIIIKFRSSLFKGLRGTGQSPEAYRKGVWGRAPKRAWFAEFGAESRSYRKMCM